MTEHLKVVIVDDEQRQLDHMQNLLNQSAKQLKITIDIDQYTSGEAFLFALEDHLDWQIAFLDIEMKAVNGMEVAKIIREKAPQLALVFATGYAEYAIEGYEVQALAYLLKPIKVEKVQVVIERFLAIQPEEEPSIIIESQGKHVRLLLNQIVYVEANQRELSIITNEESYSIKQSLTEFSKSLDHRFIQTHRSYIVNLQYVNQILTQDITLTNGMCIPLSRRKAKTVQKAFIDYYKGSVFYNG
ncbi:LytR/AlgR family response regulator transcription factor [Fundicoccus culcitae]|uniref:LytTR family DNA-binding domain-containing protein n=1 Tax=Fundicoccus culcitae TaxID=2969821 RepID=A0ABY5P6P0_9LACT|nr:LytTR family DNA-binding domain-containing protein [Fundicoccus culcitae]UUX34246.1 LytTR family DNA-binding domain-containing protein [Fundicoccus culcitae]